MSLRSSALVVGRNSIRHSEVRIQQNPARPAQLNSAARTNRIFQPRTGHARNTSKAAQKANANHAKSMASIEMTKAFSRPVRISANSSAAKSSRVLNSADRSSSKLLALDNKPGDRGEPSAPGMSMPIDEGNYLRPIRRPISMPTPADIATAFQGFSRTYVLAFPTTSLLVSIAALCSS